jgi:hypothetical protein
MINIIKHEINKCIRLLTLWKLTFWIIRISKFVLKITIDKSLWDNVVFRQVKKQSN